MKRKIYTLFTLTTVIILIMVFFVIKNPFWSASRIKYSSQLAEDILKKVLLIGPLNVDRFNKDYIFVIRISKISGVSQQYVMEYYYYNNKIIIKTRSAQENIFDKLNEYHILMDGKYSDEELIQYALKIKVSYIENTITSDSIIKEILLLEKLIRHYQQPFNNEAHCLDYGTSVIETFNPAANYYLQYQFQCPSEILNKFNEIRQSIQNLSSQNGA